MCRRAGLDVVRSALRALFIEERPLRWRVAAARRRFPPPPPRECSLRAARVARSHELRRQRDSVSLVATFGRTFTKAAAPRSVATARRRFPPPLFLTDSAFVLQRFH